MIFKTSVSFQNEFTWHNNSMLYDYVMAFLILLFRLLRQTQFPIWNFIFSLTLIILKRLVLYWLELAYQRLDEKHLQYVMQFQRWSQCIVFIYVCLKTTESFQEKPLSFIINRIYCQLTEFEFKADKNCVFIRTSN